jgi:uncharacterized glyoxalase superfamily protein PhnB
MRSSRSGGRVVMLADRLPIYPWRPPHELGGTSVGLGLYVEDLDAVVAQAVDAGARATLPVETSSTAIAMAGWPIRSGMSGRSRRIPRIWPRT